MDRLPFQSCSHEDTVGNGGVSQLGLSTRGLISFRGLNWHERMCS